MSIESPNQPATEPIAAIEHSRSTLWAIAVLVGAVSTLLIPVVALTTTNRAEIWTAVTVAALSWIALLLIRGHRSPFIAHGLIFALLGVATQGVFASGSVRSAVTFLFVGGVAAAGSFLGRRALFVATGYSVAALGLLNWAEIEGLIHKDNPEVGLKVWVTQSICVIVVGIVVYFTRARANQAHAFQIEALVRSRETEQERDRALARFARIFATSPSPMLAQSADSSLILDINPAFERCFGYTRDQVVGQTDRMLWKDDGHRRAYTQRLRTERRLSQQAARGLRSDGTVFEAKLSSELSGESNEQLIITIVTDVTEERRREAQLLDLATGMSVQTGQAFLSALVRNMAKTMGAEMVLVGELDADGVVRTMAGVMDGSPMETFAYALEGTPCQQASDRDDLCVYPDNVAELFPHDRALVEGKFKAYVGQSLRDETGQAVGILAALWRHRSPTAPSLRP